MRSSSHDSSRVAARRQATVDTPVSLRGLAWLRSELSLPTHTVLAVALVLCAAVGRPAQAAQSIIRPEGCAQQLLCAVGHVKRAQEVSVRILHSACSCSAALGLAAQALRGALQGRAAWPVPTSACDSSCCSLCQSSGPQERALCSAAPAASGHARSVLLDVARPLMHSAEGSAASVGFCSEPETRSSRERAGLRCTGGAKQAAKRGAMDAAAALAEGAAGDADSAGSGGSGGLRQAQNHASSSNLSACTEVEEREPVKRVRLLRPRGGGGLGEACSGDSEALPSCSTRCSTMFTGIAPVHL